MPNQILTLLCGHKYLKEIKSTSLIHSQREVIETYTHWLQKVEEMHQKYVFDRQNSFLIAKMLYDHELD